MVHGAEHGEGSSWGWSIVCLKIVCWNSFGLRSYRFIRLSLLTERVPSSIHSISQRLHRRGILNVRCRCQIHHKATHVPLLPIASTFTQTRASRAVGHLCDMRVEGSWIGYAPAGSSNWSRSPPRSHLSTLDTKSSFLPAPPRIRNELHCHHRRLDTSLCRTPGTLTPPPHSSPSSS